MEQNPSGKRIAEPKRWSSLPDDIISNIFSRLDFPQNSIITISDTTFDINLSNLIKNMSEINPILDNLFTIFTTPLLNIVRLHLYHIHPTLTLFHVIDSWARRLRFCNVEHFKITSNTSLFGNAFRQVHVPNVFLIQSLVSLELDLNIHGYVWIFPDSINLPNLKKFSSIFVDLKCIERFMSSCPSLEDLSFVLLNNNSGCRRVSWRTCPLSESYPKPFADGSLTIAGKNLTRLCITLFGSFQFNWIISNDFTGLNLHVDAPKLDHFNLTAPRLILKHDQIIRQMIYSVSHVKSLVLDIANHMMIRSNIPKTKTIFPNVTHLTWTMWQFERLETLRLLLPCPKLEVLVLKIMGVGNVDVIPDAKFKLYEHMKRLELDTGMVQLDEQLLTLVKYFLTSALSLEKLVLGASVSCPYNNRRLAEAARFHQNLLDCQRCSSSLCEIEFVGAYRSLIYPINFDSE